VSAEQLVGLAEVADLLGVSKRTASRYANRPDFPDPIGRLRAGPVWRKSDIERWRDDNLPLTVGRPPSTPRH
jgi:predicted DNA-binding transcriptional regulator AlpA